MYIDLKIACLALLKTQLSEELQWLSYLPSLLQHQVVVMVLGLLGTAAHPIRRSQSGTSALAPKHHVSTCSMNPESARQSSPPQSLPVPAAVLAQCRNLGLSILIFIFTPILLFKHSVVFPVW